MGAYRVVEDLTAKMDTQFVQFRAEMAAQFPQIGARFGEAKADSRRLGAELSFFSMVAGACWLRSDYFSRRKLPMSLYLHCY